MRIGDRPQNGNDFSGNRERSDAQAFRRGRKVGQIVRGRLLAPGPSGLYWVVVAGHKLLARLDHEPIPGRELVFRIEALEPELVLKDITPPPSVADDPGLLLAALATARTRFERRLARFVLLPAPPLDLSAARRAFRAWLADDAAARADYDAVRKLFRQAAAFLPAGEGRLFYAPWVFAGLTDSEALATRLSPAAGGPGFTLRFFGRLPDVGAVALQGSHHPGGSGAPGRTIYRLMAQRVDAAEGIVAALSALRLGNAALAPACLSLAPLPEALAAGFLARLVAAARPFTGLRIRV